MITWSKLFMVLLTAFKHGIDYEEIYSHVVDATTYFELIRSGHKKEIRLTYKECSKLYMVHWIIIIKVPKRIELKDKERTALY